MAWDFSREDDNRDYEVCKATPIGTAVLKRAATKDTSNSF